MFSYSKALKKFTIHNSSCPHCKAIKADNLQTIETLSDFNIQGCHFCLSCFGLIDLYEQEKDQLDKLQISNKISIHYHQEQIFIKSLLSQWIIFIDLHDQIQLYHKNSNKKHNEDSEIYGYHNQNVQFNTLHEFVEYIIEHDDYRRTHPDSHTYHARKPKRYSQGYKQFIKHKKANKNHRDAVATMNLIDQLIAQSGQSSIIFA